MPSKPASEKSLKRGKALLGEGAVSPSGSERGAGKLYIVATPIGNLADLTLRALETLRAVDLIAAEDTRHTRKLLSYYDIHKPLVSYHEHNAKQRGSELLEKIASGQSIAVVTDAGTPGISDPGALLIEEALQHGVEPISIPGPAALISALVVSGLPTDSFAFLGFPPSKGGDRRRFFEKNAELSMTLILYESPNRLVKTLRDILENWGDRRIAIARELTKMHEEIFRGIISQAVDYFGGEVLGELTLVIEGNEEGKAQRPEVDSASWEEVLRDLLNAGLSSKEAASAVSSRFGVPRRVVYKAALAIKH
jgi:16S rRNA (cytidine1402-2'-O)-methyltransferase